MLGKSALHTMMTIGMMRGWAYCTTSTKWVLNEVQTSFCTSNMTTVGALLVPSSSAKEDDDGTKSDGLFTNIGWSICECDYWIWYFMAFQIVIQTQIRAQRPTG